VRFTPSGRAVANFTLATTERWTDPDGNRKEHTEWHTIVVWGKQAETCGEYLDKGSPILVEGRLQTRDWETKDGQKRSVVEVVAERVQFMGRARATAGAAPAPPETLDQASNGDDEVPF
jgi:single-strand DNA-binding protein